jgi:hypothetical protein
VEDTFADLFEPHPNPIAVHRLERQGLENQHVQGALYELPLLSLFSSRQSRWDCTVASLVCQEERASTRATWHSVEIRPVVIKQRALLDHATALMLLRRFGSKALDASAEEARRVRGWTRS